MEPCCHVITPAFCVGFLACGHEQNNVFDDAHPDAAQACAIGEMPCLCTESSVVSCTLPYVLTAASRYGRLQGGIKHRYIDERDFNCRVYLTQ